MQAARKMLNQVPEEPWATVCADIVGTLPKSMHRNQKLLAMIDRFPLRSATAESLKKAFRERIIARYGVPKVVITDNGVQLESQKNPSERENRTVKTMIAQFAGQNQRNWDEKWLEIMLAVNTSTSESTGHTSAFFTQGRALDEHRRPPSQTPILREVFEIVRRNMKKRLKDSLQDSSLQ